MNGKVVVMTGASSGIGQAAAGKLASMGAKIVQVARNRERGEAALQRLRSIAPGPAHTVHYADLSLMREAKQVASAIAAGEPRIDVLINNAGAIFGSRQLTDEGLERTFALNHMSYFVLTHYLLARMRDTGQARIVNTASDAHAIAPLDFDDLQSEKTFQASLFETLRHGGPGFKVYGRSKLCNILFTRELARRLAGTAITANSVHPGFVATRFADHAGGFIAFATRVAKRFARPVEKGAETLVFLAASDQVQNVSGEYFHDCKITPVSAPATDAAAAQRLWSESEKLAGLNG